MARLIAAPGMGGGLLGPWYSDDISDGVGGSFQLEQAGTMR